MAAETFVDLGFAKVDTSRRSRRGFPEAVYAQGKTGEELAAILDTLVQNDGVALATRASKSQFELVRQTLADARFNELGRCIILERRKLPRLDGRVAIASAGTTDRFVVEEIRETLELFGVTLEVVQDIGVAGLHRTFAAQPIFEKVNVVIVVAGMDGALPSVIGGLISKPVIAVPTSVGYGASFGGITALLSMLNSCANGVTVVNIDNGFGAAYAAALIIRNAALALRKHSE
jgi:pyridinium-3,5-biscarboxylic acid mononucleotide synthase